MTWSILSEQECQRRYLRWLTSEEACQKEIARIQAKMQQRLIHALLGSGPLAGGQLPQ